MLGVLVKIPVRDNSTGMEPAMVDGRFKNGEIVALLVRP
jgi:hypothetical protein